MRTIARKLLSFTALGISAAALSLAVGLGTPSAAMADEADAKTSAISVDSPLARALLKKRVGDDVVFEAAGKAAAMSIISIRYQS